MRRVVPILLSLLILLAFVLISELPSVGHPAKQDLQPSSRVEWKAHGEDQARVVVRSVDIVPSDRPGDRIDATLGSPRMMRFVWVVTFDVTEVLRGRFPDRELRILVHSPSADLGVRANSRKGILHRYRSRWGRQYEFAPE